MCGRFSLSTAEKELLESRFDVEVNFNLVPRYNIAPFQSIPTILNESSHILGQAKWGLVPSWAKDDKFKMINARCETIDQKPAYKKSFESRRCLVIADSFFEWKKVGNNKVPYRAMLSFEEPFAFAGIYDIWNNNIGVSIITTTPNEVMAEIHDRMPVILHQKDEKQWLKEGGKDSLVPYDGELRVYPVSPLVNSPKNDSPDVIEAIPTNKGLSGFI